MTRKRSSRSADAARCDLAVDPSADSLVGGDELLATAPRDRAALERWLRDALDLSFAPPLVEGHRSPLEYLCHAFFQGRAGFEVAATHGPTSEPPAALDCVVWACRGGGKTFLGALATALDLIFKPGIEIRILGGSMDQSRRMHTHLRRLFARPLLEPLVKGKPGETRLILKNGSEVELLAQSHASVRGTRVQTLRCDEAELFKPDVLEAAMLTTRSRTITVPGVGPVALAGTVECLSTMHIPFGVMHRLLRETLEGRRTLFKWGVADVLETCPASRSCEGCVLRPECDGRAKRGEDSRGGHIAIDDAVRMKRRVSLATWNAEMLCLRPNRTHAVFPEFDSAVHVFNEERVPAMPLGGAIATALPPSQREGLGVGVGVGLGVGPLRVESRGGSGSQVHGTHPPSLRDGECVLCGMDFGIRSPAVVLWALLRRDVLEIVEERHLEGVTLPEHIAAIVRGGELGWPMPKWIGIDPAGAAENDQTGKSAADLLTEAGLVVKKKRTSVRDGLNLVHARLAPADGTPPRLRVHARCEKLIESLERYHYDPNKPESTDPVKDGFDHAVDALRYLITNLDRPSRTEARTYIQ
ncbi:MAG: hypothetical protein K2Y21_00140 [Phycisphaerales bacterium]|nr:hypothetical protein [Phycisphaerales bacterium]